MKLLNFKKWWRQKNRLLSKNNWYGSYDRLISNIPKPVKKSVSSIKEKIMNLLPKDYKPKKILGAFNYIKYKSEGNEQLTIKQYLGNAMNN